MSKSNTTQMSAALAALMPALMMIVSLGTSNATAAEPGNATYTFDIPAQNLNDALQALALTSQHKLLYSSKLVDGRESPALKGEYTAEEAVRKLLAGTALAYQVTADGLVVITDPKEMKAPVSMENAPVKEGIRLARAQSNDSSSADETATQQKASAQGTASTESGGSKVEEIVVTAQRRQERLQDVPISISVLTGEHLDASTGRGVLEELSKVPAVTMLPQPEGRSTIVIRGVAPQAGVAPVGYYFDLAPISFLSLGLAPDADVYDLQRVEVLKGPQGTGYGVGSTIGVVRVLTNDPDPSKVEAKGRVLTSSTQGGEMNYRGDAAVNAPIIDGRLAIRGVVGFENWGGWIDRPNKPDANGSDATNIRLKIGGELVDGLSTVVGVWHSKRRSGIDASTDTQTRNVLYDEHSDAVTDLYSFVLKKDFSAFSLVSSTSYLDIQAGYFKRSIFTTVGNVLVNDWNAHARSEEINLTSNGTGPWKWTAGVFYRSAAERSRNKIAQLAVIDTLAFTNDDNFKTDSYAVFGELGYSFSQFELLTGLRYTREENTVFSIPPGAAYSATPTKVSFSKVTPRLVLNWKPSRDVTTYLSYAEGFRSGIIQQQAAIVRGFGPVESDLLRNYELGNKATVLNGKLSWEAAVYFMDWKDVQQALTLPVFQAGQIAFQGAFANAGSASGFGGEVSVTLRPTERIQIGGSYSQSDLTFDSDVQSGGIVLFPKGDRLATSPESTYSAFAEYTAPVGADLEFQVGANVSHFSSQIQRFLIGGVTDINDDPITIAGLNIGIGRKDGSRRVSLFVDNINNTDAATGNNYDTSTPTIGNPDEGLRPRPRTVGVQVEMKF